MYNAGTSSTVHRPSRFDAEDYYRENLTQGERGVLSNIDNVDLPEHGTSSETDSDDLPNADVSREEVLFETSSSDNDSSNSSQRPMSMSPFCGEQLFPQPIQQLAPMSQIVPLPEFHSHEISFLDRLLEGPDVFADTYDLDYVSQAAWCEPQDLINGSLYLEKGMFFAPKKILQRAVKLLHFRIVREFSVVKSTKIHWRVACKRADRGCEFKLTACMSKEDNM